MWDCLSRNFVAPLQSPGQNGTIHPSCPGHVKGSLSGPPVGRSVLWKRTGTASLRFGEVSGMVHAIGFSKANGYILGVVDHDRDRVALYTRVIQAGKWKVNWSIRLETLAESAVRLAKNIN